MTLESQYNWYMDFQKSIELHYRLSWSINAFIDFHSQYYHEKLVY